MAAVRTWSNKGTHWSSHKYDCLSRDHKDTALLKLLTHKGYSVLPLTEERNML